MARIILKTLKDTWRTLQFDSHWYTSFGIFFWFFRSWFRWNEYWNYQKYFVQGKFCLRCTVTLHHRVRSKHHNGVVFLLIFSINRYISALHWSFLWVVQRNWRWNWRGNVSLVGIRSWSKMFSYYNQLIQYRIDKRCSRKTLSNLWKTLSRRSCHAQCFRGLWTGMTHIIWLIRPYTFCRYDNVLKCMANIDHFLKELDLVQEIQLWKINFTNTRYAVIFCVGWVDLRGLTVRFRWK